MTDCMHTDCWLRWNNICFILGDHWCPLYKTHEGWCAYWDCNIELMQHRGVKCLMDDAMNYAIERVMEDKQHGR